MANSGSSYIMNEWVAVTWRNPFGVPDPSQNYTNRKDLARPAETYVMFVAATRWAPSVYADHTHSRNWTSWSNVTWDISTDRYGNDGPAPFLNGSSNYLFADTHVEQIQAPKLKELIDADVNFSRPPQ
jgi:prepilin-type processing-associated H-X9-DG protein